MVLRLAEQLELPLRERNALLLAAGFAPMYRERRARRPAAGAGARARCSACSTPTSPRRRWRSTGTGTWSPPTAWCRCCCSGVAPELLQPPVNVLRVSLHPRGLAPMIANLRAWRAHVLSRLRRQIAATGDRGLQRLLDELRGACP